MNRPTPLNMKHIRLKSYACGFAWLSVLFTGHTIAAPTVSRLTPPSELFATGKPIPLISRFLPGQRFDLQATIAPDGPTKTITSVSFAINGRTVQWRTKNKDESAVVALRQCTSGCLKEVPINATIATIRAVSVDAPGVHELAVTATQSDGQTVTAKGNFEVVPLVVGGKKIKNIIFLLGDGLGVTQRTAARMVKGYAQGKALAPLAMDSFPVSGMVKTSSLNSIVTDSSPGMTAYVLGNKNDNNEEGVFPDDTIDFFDNPRIEYLSEYLHRTQGKALGIVTTADVFDATPAGNAVHTSNRRAGTGIVDQFFDDRHLSGLKVLMGGGRKWFLPMGTTGSSRSDRNDYAFSATDSHTSEIVKRWGASAGTLDANRDLIQEFKDAGFQYSATKTDMDGTSANVDRLLGLYAFSNMNVALDKIDGRRANKTGINGTVVDDYGLPDQPMLDEMAARALSVLANDPKGFFLLIEGASIDKQAHAMDSERWMLDTLEFDRAVKVAQDFANADGQTLVIVTADHECSGAAIIGGSRLTDAKLVQAGNGGGKEGLRDKNVGIYEQAGFPKYRMASDGYPETTDIDFRMLIGYGGNADRYEDWRTNRLPLKDASDPFEKTAPISTYPAKPIDRDVAGGFLITGQVPGNSAVHTASDVPLSAFGPGAYEFTGVMDNTDVFFKLAQAALGGVILPKGLEQPQRIHNKVRAKSNIKKTNLSSGR
jgi:alkaline phosphatase